MDPFDLRRWPGFQAAGGSPSNPALINQIAIDSRRIHCSPALFVALKGQKQDGHQFVSQAAKAGATFALVSNQFIPTETIPGLTLLRVENPLAAFQEIAACYRQQQPAKIVGITGSFGKTMVKDLLARCLSTQMQTAASPESFNSQIGVPLSLMTLNKEHDIAVIEAAISQKNEMDTLAEMICPDFTIVTQLGRKHMATLNDLATLSDEVNKFVQTCPDSGWTLLPSNLKESPPAKGQIYYWDREGSGLPHAKLIGSEWNPGTAYQVDFPDQTVYEGSAKAVSIHFLNLINMAVKAAWLLGISSNHIKAVLDQYHPESTYTEIWKAPKGTIIVNEPYCSDPQSVEKAISHFDYASSSHRKIFVFGGMRSRQGQNDHDYRPIGQALARVGLNHLILYGSKPYANLVEEIRKGSKETIISIFENQTEALEYLSAHIHNLDYIVIKGDRKIPLEHLTEIFHDSLSNNQCTINLAAIKANIALIRKKLPPETRLMIIVKALAYGTDDIRLAKFLSECSIDILGVSYIDEGISLKRAGITQAIFAINAAPYEAAKAVKWDLEVGVSNREFIHAIAKEAKKQGKKVKVHLHIDTGMGRFGCRPEEVLDLAKLITTYPELILDGVMTHLACADEPKDDPFTWSQIEKFDACIALLKREGIEVKWTHAANSSGAIRLHLPQYNMVRIGLAAFGLYVSEAARQTFDLRLALSLSSRIVGINICKKGETVSYARSYLVEKDEQRIAVLPIGYFDGMHRHYSGKSTVLIRGKKAPMIGNICMDYMMVDITDIPDAAIGDKVLIFGQDEYGQYISPEELASHGNSVVHELITCLGPRIQRIFVDEESNQIR